MATSSRQAALFGVNDWKAIYQTFREADFRSYDYETLRKSFIDYLKIYYPETYNDYIESSEFVALLDVIAFMGQGLAFRNDLNARENFIDTAERRDSVIKLANLVGYTPKRNLAAEGYLKIVSIRTSQNITDLNGFNLSNATILWNDPANTNWLEQFNTILNATLIDSQRIGKPGNTTEILNVITSEYSMRIPNGTIPTAPFKSPVSGVNTSFELVSVSTVGKNYVYELPPAPTSRFNFLFRNDRLGFGSPNNGYFFYFKQGTLKTADFSLQQQISNQVIPIDIEGINNTDTWLYQLKSDGTYEPWQQVESVYADAYLQNETSQRTIFSVSSRFNDQVSYVFGDGVFSKIPVGNYRAFVRQSNAETYSIDPIEMQGITVAFKYVSRVGRVETLQLGLQLQLPVSNAKARESLSNIKQRAPTRFYSQNRMVNGEDYNNFPYTYYSSIIKSKAINRSSIGVSKNLDLLDATKKYSSTNSFGDDGALYQDEKEGYLKLTITNVSDIIAFLTNTLSSALASNDTNQYYIVNSSDNPDSFYKRFNINTASGDGTIYWQSSIVNANSENGYFYSVDSLNKVPIFLGTYSSTNLKYVTVGAMLKFIAPPGYYFDKNNRLVSGIPTSSDKTHIWSTVLNVVADGSNNGKGNFPNGNGPVTLNGYVPTGAILTQVIPVFDNSLSPEIVQECLINIELARDFLLIFDNTLTIDKERWFLDVDFNNQNYFVKFVANSPTEYTITYRALNYYFGSVGDTRFTYAKDELVYDPFTGKLLQDFVSVLSTNSTPTSSSALGRDYKVTIIGQTLESDGYVNDFQVKVSSTDSNNRQIFLNPDFFQELTGVQVNASNIGKYVFFEYIQDAVNLSRYQIIPSSDVVYIYPTKIQVETNKYEYPLGTIFYAYNEVANSNDLSERGVFYITVQDPAINSPFYVLVEQPQYSVKPGRQGFSYQYRHNSNNTTRIDPATTNIIDLYLVTQSYYTQYQNWIKDTTNTIVEPDPPTIAELSLEYTELQDYKMISDSVIMNSVVFKPLFGPKADPALRGTIKVIKDSNTGASNSEIKSAVLTAMNDYFSVNNWNFGDTFYFSELSAYLHEELGELISSAVLVPADPTKPFGDLYEIQCAPYEIFVNGATANDIQVITALTSDQLQVR